MTVGRNSALDAPGLDGCCPTGSGKAMAVSSLSFEIGFQM